MIDLRPYAGWIAVGLLLSHGGTYVVGRWHGGDAEKRAEAKRLEKAVRKVAKREVKAAAITDKAAEKLQLERGRIEYRTKTIIEKVPVYVTPAADAACAVPVGFVRLHDAAASGGEAALPVAPGGSIDAPSGVALSAVAETVGLNYGAAYQWRAEALTWRAWYVEQAAAWTR